MIDQKMMDEAMAEVGQMLEDTASLRFDLPESVTAQEGWEEEVRFIGGWLRHIEHTLEAVALLVNNEHPHAAAPLVRLALEDAVSAALVARDPKAWEAVLAKAQDSEGRVLRDMYQAGLTPPDELKDLVDSLPPSAPDGYGPVKNMTARFKALGDDGARLLALWGLLTQQSHGNIHTASLFLDFDGGPGGIPSIRLDPQLPADLLNLHFTSLDCMLLATESYSQVLVGDPLGSAVQAIHARKAAVEEKLIKASRAD
ncbi:hypothetical protein CLV30_106173 [Haloactinopolyspora alba]|uniref:Uncharacterized protein n=1 Tax=Haloactinopolyspora alba TaxID=648780 RepID=A0A2P8E3W4_9ACTN|nr:hypothetical protein [Haloactinopolyspora alba]PSL04168.1 hypothetical protein CLV30_106173 [Haloactinopolyspora alba]